MSERKKEETYLINLITNPRHKLEVENACEIVKKIWTSEVRIVREYTDHGYEHSQRIIQKFIEIIYVFLTIFLYLLKCPQSLILSALRAFCFCGKPHISRSIFLYFRYQSWLKSW